MTFVSVGTNDLAAYTVAADRGTTPSPTWPIRSLRPCSGWSTWSSASGRPA